MAVTHAYQGIPPVVLSGVGRSGTFALREALGRHGAVHSTGSENNILYELLHAARVNCTIESRRFAMRVDDDAYDAAFRRLISDLLWPRPRDPLPRRLLAFTALSPTRADYLCRLFPGVKVLYLVRNGIEVVASRQRHASFAGRPFREHCEVWALAGKMIEWGRDRDDFMLLRHETLLDDDAMPAVLDRVWAWIGLDAEPAPAAFLRDNCVHPTHDGGDDSLRHRHERWRQWTASQRDVFTGRCGDLMASLGYAMPWAAVTRTACAP